MAPPTDNEVIDLTTSTPPPGPIVIIDSDDDVEVDRTAKGGAASGSRREKTTARKRRKARLSEAEEGELVVEFSSAERERSRDRRGVSDSNGAWKEKGEETGSRKARDQHGRQRKDVASRKHTTPLHLPEQRARIPDDGSELFHVDTLPGEPGTKRQRRNSRSREETSPPRRISHSPERQTRPSDVGPDLFYVDVKPTPVPLSAKPSLAAVVDGPTATGGSDLKLLLPPHVAVFGVGESGVDPVEILPPVHPDSDEEDYIEFLDTDDRKTLGMTRYFDDDDDEEEVLKPTKPTKFLCKNCGQEGAHKTWECPVDICLTCGARDEHTTRSCPISKTCYNCGMRGHINKTCPNRFAAPDHVGYYDACDRCGSNNHKTNECPTLWRLYEYLTDGERATKLRKRDEKQDLVAGNDDEGDTAADPWCYNCGFCGHWGDDCDDVPHLPGFSTEPSAFSTHNTISGPFYDPDNEPAPSTSPYKERSLRQWENMAGADSWGQNAPANVGRNGKKNDRAKMAQKYRDQQEEDDPDDWFGNPRNPGRPAEVGNAPPSAPKKMRFGFAKESRQSETPAAPRDQERRKPNLLDRIGDVPPPLRPDYDRSLSRRNGRRRHGASRGPSGLNAGDRIYDSGRPPVAGFERARARERGDDGRSSRDKTGPRYKGGYSR